MQGEQYKTLHKLFYIQNRDWFK